VCNKKDGDKLFFSTGEIRKRILDPLFSRREKEEEKGGRIFGKLK